VPTVIATAIIAPVTPLLAVAAADAGGGASAAPATAATDAIAAIGTGVAAGTQAAAAAPKADGKLIPTAPAPGADKTGGDSAQPAAPATADAGTNAQAQLAAGIQTANATTDAQAATGAHATAHPGADAAATTQGGGANRTDDSSSNQPSQPTPFASNLLAQPNPTAPANGPAAAASLQPLAANAAGATNAAAPAAAPTPTQNAAATAMAIPLAGVPIEIAARAQAGTNRFEIRLDPPDLGRIDVQLSVDKQGNVTSHLVADRSSTLDLLRRDAPQLQRALQDAGLKTSGDNLQFSLRDQSANTQSQQQQQQQNFQNPAATRTARIALPTDDVQPVETARSYGRLFGVTGGLDIRV